MKAIKIDEIIDDVKDSQEIEQQLEKSRIGEIENENYSQLSSEVMENESDDDTFDDEDLMESCDDYDEEYSEVDNDDIVFNEEMDDNLVYIDDIEGLSDLLEEDKVSEMYPGVLRYNGKENDIN
jgi:hypothetical protein